MKESERISQRSYMHSPWIDKSVVKAGAEGRRGGSRGGRGGGGGLGGGEQKGEMGGICTTVNNKKKTNLLVPPECRAELCTQASLSKGCLQTSKTLLPSVLRRKACSVYSI